MDYLHLNMGIIAAAAIGAVGAIGGSMISANGQKSAARDANRQRQAAYNKARGYVDNLWGRSDAFLRKAFGDELNPEAFLYHPVNLTKSQLDTIKGNLKAFPSALELTDQVNPSIWANDLGRIRTMMPQFDKARDSYIGTTRQLQEGKLPYSDVMDIFSSSATTAAAGGTPGGSRNATLKDLGLSRLDAMDRGNSMFAGFMQVAQQISPVEHQMRPQQMFFTPQERATMDIEQAALEQQGRASAELARAMPDPATNALVNARMGIEMASMGAQYNPTGGLGAMALGQGISQGSAMVANMMMQNQGGGQQGIYGQAPQGGAPTSMDGFYNPYGGAGAQQVEFVPSSYSSFNPNSGLSGGGSSWGGGTAGYGGGSSAGYSSASGLVGVAG